MPIPFTQFVLPDGRQKPVNISRSEAVETKALRIIEAGYRFECEVLGNSHISITITNDDGDQAVEICENGPAVPRAVDKLIEGFKL